LRPERLSTADSPRWHWRRLLAAPHRLAFFAGALMFALSAAWWAAAMPLRAAEAAWQVPPGLAHGLLMSGSFMPMFFAGFLFTAGPRWLQRPSVAASVLRVPVGLHLVGWLLFMAGTHLSLYLAAVGLVLAAAAFGHVSWRFAQMLRKSHASDTTHARLLLAGCLAGSTLLLVAATSLATDHLLLTRAALHAGLWACNALVFVSAIHRMLPFFSDAALDAWPPQGLLPLLVMAVLAQALLGAAELLWWPLPSWLRVAQALCEAALAALLLWLAWRSRRRPSPSMRLLVMLHLGFVWFGLAWALNAASHGLMLAGHAGLGLAALHALTAGFMGSTLFAMVARISAGHGGRAVVADNTLWRLFWLLQLAVIARVSGALWPAAEGALLMAAALAWALACIAWALRYGRWYGMGP
jgi:uncharacterized protein involved in response to NO